MGEMDDIVKEFIAESNENLDQLDQDILSLEKEPTSKLLIGGIFRTIHSIKGATGFLGFAKLGEVAHCGESLLSLLRDGSLTLQPEIIAGLLSLVDGIRKMLCEIEAHGQEGDGDYSALTAELIRLQKLKRPLVPGADGMSAKIIVASINGPTTELGDSSNPREVPHQCVNTQAAPRAATAILRDRAFAFLADGSALSGENVEASRETAGIASAGGSLRVGVQQLDILMNLVGELVLTRNQILQICTRQPDADLLIAAQQLNSVTSELQESVTKVRMQPIDNIWQKFPRLVRDVAAQCGKQIVLEMEGKETELDKAVIEAMKDPLTHVIRNAIDHGIESPEARRANGKSPIGHLLLRAFHQNGQVNIEIRDDGRGIDLPAVRQKAIDAGLISPQQAGELDEQKTLELVFLPGFSMAKEISNISGRGVGMDIVKTNIEKIGGTVEIASHVLVGTTTTMRIPLSVAIIPALMVRSGEERYAIPQANIVELVRLSRAEAEKHIHRISGTSIYRLRDHLLPLLYLASELTDAAHDHETPRGETASDGAATILAMLVNDRHFALVVDEVLDMEEIVVRSLGKHMKGAPIYSGATILGDGRVAPIIDVLNMARRSGVLGHARQIPNTVEKDRAESPSLSQNNFLLVVTEDDQHLAIPLHHVSRLEQFETRNVEMAGNQQVVQYCGEVLPLFFPNDLLPGRSKPGRQEFLEMKGKGRIQVVVCQRNGHPAGLIVKRVLDIESDTRKHPGRVINQADAPAIMQGHVTAILALEEILASAAYIPGLKPAAIEVLA